MSAASKTTKVIRVGVAGAIGAIAVALYVESQPSTRSSPESIQRLRALDADMAESAPQQTVVNGWETNDLLAYMAEQQDAYAAQHSLLLLVLAVIGALLLFSPLVTHAPGAPRHPAAQPTAPTASNVGQVVTAPHGNPTPTAQPQSPGINQGYTPQ